MKIWKFQQDITGADDWIHNCQYKCMSRSSFIGKLWLKFTHWDLLSIWGLVSRGITRFQPFRRTNLFWARNGVVDYIYFYSHGRLPLLNFTLTGVWSIGGTAWHSGHCQTSVQLSSIRASLVLGRESDLQWPCLLFASGGPSLPPPRYHPSLTWNVPQYHTKPA